MHCSPPPPTPLHSSGDKAIIRKSFKRKMSLCYDSRSSTNFVLTPNFNVIYETF